MSDIRVFLLNMYIMYETVESMGRLEECTGERERDVGERRNREQKRARKSERPEVRER